MGDSNLNSISNKKPNEPGTKNEEFSNSSFLSPSEVANSTANSTPKSNPNAQREKRKEGAAKTSASNIQSGYKKKRARKKPMRRTTFQGRSTGSGESPWLSTPTTNVWDFGGSSALEYFNARDSEGNYLWENAFMSVLNQNQVGSLDGLRNQGNLDTQTAGDPFGGSGSSWQQEVPIRSLTSDLRSSAQTDDFNFRLSSYDSSNGRLNQDQFSSQSSTEFGSLRGQSLPSRDLPSIWENPFSVLQTNSNQFPKNEGRGRRFESDRGSRVKPFDRGNSRSSSREQFSLNAREFPDKGERRRKHGQSSPGFEHPPKQRRTQNPQQRNQPSKPATSSRAKETSSKPEQSAAAGQSRPPPTTKEPFSKKMAVVIAEHPVDKLSKDQVDNLQSSLLEAIKQTAGEGPQFNGCTSEDGGLVLDCADEKAVSWLQKTISAMNPWCGVNLKMVGAKKLACSAFEKISLRIPKDFDQVNDAKILDMVAKQNHGLKVNEWEVLARNLEDDTVDLVVKIPYSAVETLRKMSFMVYFGFDRAKTSILKNSQ